MAALGSNFIRVRLYFDYPPPAVMDCRMCWLLVDLNTCRVVADLESLIRERFEFSRSSFLNLYIEDCYLPHTESIYLVRDNDSVRPLNLTLLNQINTLSLTTGYVSKHVVYDMRSYSPHCWRVKVDCLTQVNGHSSHSELASDTCRKRQRPADEDGAAGNGEGSELKKKKRKKQNEESPERDGKQVPSEEQPKTSQGKQKQKKKKKKKTEENSHSTTTKTAPLSKKPQTNVEQQVKRTKKPLVAKAKTQNVTSSDSSCSSSEEEPLEKTKVALETKPKTAPKTPLPIPVAPKTTSARKPTQKKPQPPSSTSSESESSADEASTVKVPPKSKPITSTTTSGSPSNSLKPPEAAQSTVPPPPNTEAEPCNDDSEEEIQLVIRRPMQQLGRGVAIQSSWRGGRGRGNTWGGDRGNERGRGRHKGRGAVLSSCNGATEPSYHTESLTNTSVVFQNGTESTPERDYSTMPLLAAPSQVGQKIAFKLLELTENYTPEVSEYKEGTIVSFDSTTNQVELELQHICQAPVEPGKFDLVYQNEDGSERVEYAVSRGSRVTERWESLLEPRLII